MEALKEEWYNIRDVQQIDTPALVFYLDRVKHNISVALSMVNNDPSRLRPHVKTHKCIEIAQLLMNAGVTKFKCATISEAEMLAMANAPDILLSYQPGGPKLKRFVQLIKKYPSSKFSCLVDCSSNADEMNFIASGNNVLISVYIDLNVGMNRTGITPDQRVVDLVSYLHTLRNISFKGLHVYDGHIRLEDFEERTLACNHAFQSVQWLIDELNNVGQNNFVVVGGGSATFPIHAKRQNFECSPGTFVLWDHGYQQILKEQIFLPAALVLTRAISLPNDSLICLDLGHKSIAPENALDKRVYFLNANDVEFVSQSEEHLVIKTQTECHCGEVFYGIPNHVCPTVAMYEKAIVIKDNSVYDEWKIIARDRKITI